MKAFRTKPVHQNVNLHYHNFIFLKKSKTLVLRVTSICQKGADIPNSLHIKIYQFLEIH